MPIFRWRHCRAEYGHQDERVAIPNVYRSLGRWLMISRAAYNAGFAIITAVTPEAAYVGYRSPPRAFTFHASRDDDDHREGILISPAWGLDAGGGVSRRFGCDGVRRYHSTPLSHLGNDAHRDMIIERRQRGEALHAT